MGASTGFTPDVDYAMKKFLLQLEWLVFEPAFFIVVVIAIIVAGIIGRSDCSCRVIIESKSTPDAGE